MRKLSVCLLTAATAMAAAGAVPVTALAATGTYNLSLIHILSPEPFMELLSAPDTDEDGAFGSSCLLYTSRCV